MPINEQPAEDETELVGPPEPGAAEVTKLLGVAILTRTEPDGDDLAGVYHSRFQWRTIRMLGKGGFGAVYEAEPLDPAAGESAPLPARGALKVIKTSMNGTAEELLKRELSSLLPFKGPFVPRVYDWGIDRDLAFVVMQFCPGGSLLDRLARGERLTIAEGWRLLRDLLRALAEGHRLNILHLDIKPANVLVGEAGAFLLADFGIAQGNYVDSSVVRPGIGSAGYRAPEQTSRDVSQLGVQTDLYGVGATVWSALTGLPLSDPKVTAWVVRPEMGSTLISLNAVRRDCPEEFAGIVDALVQRNPLDRPGSAAEVLSWVAESLEGTNSKSGLDVALEREAPPSAETAAVVRGLIDALWLRTFGDGLFNNRIVKFHDGDYICRQGEASYFALILLKGRVEIEFNGKVVDAIDREGEFVGEVAALTGHARTASVRAAGDVWACVFNSTQLERMVLAEPAIGIRLIKALAERVANERIRHSSGEVRKQ